MKTLLIANRGEIACRIIRTAKSMGIKTIAVYSDVDCDAVHTTLADEAVSLGGATATDSYLDTTKIFAAAELSGADAVHPGYGFLSENAAFARECEQRGLCFVGPPASAIDAMGSKSAAKAIMTDADVPLLPGYHGEDQAASTLLDAAKETGFPVLLKAAAGGGGKGMRIVETESAFSEALAAAKREAAKSFGDDKMLVEKFLTHPRHIELQIFVDQHGNAVHIFDRDCSIQRRHQKIIEEAPAPDIDDAVRERMANSAIAAARAIDYVGAGTVEFLLDSDGAFFFMEMNTRLQVEHPISEMISGQDFVAWQIEIARGNTLPLAQHELSINGHSIESRIYAENPENDFLPDSGILARLRFPEESASIRVDTGVTEGDEISIHYDPMIAKVIVHAVDRETAISRMRRALEATRIVGPETNIDYLLRILKQHDFIAAPPSTSFVNEYATALKKPQHQPVDVIAAAIVVAEGYRSDNLWQQFPAWRANLPKQLPIVLTDSSGDTCVVLHYNDHTLSSASIDDVSYAVSATVADDHLTIAVDGHRLQRRWLRAEDRLLISGDQHFAFRIAHADTGDSDDAGTDTMLRAPMSGKVVAVAKQAGDTVEKGDAIIIVEAMKMEHTLRAAGTGTIEQCHVTEGDLVSGDQLLAVVDFDNGEQ